MDLTQAILEKYGPKEEARSLTVDAKLREELTMFSPNLAGVNINDRSILGLVAGYACIRTISSDLAMLPHNPIEISGKTRQVATEEPVYKLLRKEARDEATAFNWLQTWYSQAVGWGNAYSLIEFRGDGKPAEIWNVSPKSYPDRTPFTKKLFYSIDGKSQAPWKVLHMKGLSPDGMKGYSPVALCKQSIALGIAVELYGASFYGNSAVPKGVLKAPFELSDPAYERLRTSFEGRHQGLGNANKIAILEGGVEFQPTSVGPEEAQFLMSREFTIEEVARIYGVPPSKIGHLKKANFNTLEQQNLDYAISTLGPWAANAQQELNRKLFTESEQSRFYVNINFKALLKGDMRSRADFYEKMARIGGLNPNDIRELEDLNGIGPQGDEYLVPLNHGPLRLIAEGKGMKNAK